VTYAGYFVQLRCSSQGCSDCVCNSYVEGWIQGIPTKFCCGSFLKNEDLSGRVHDRMTLRCISVEMICRDSK
jgi:hypothetical protein